MKKNLKFFSLINCLIIVNILNSQTIIDFKLRFDENNYVGYKNLDLAQTICKGDSIFGIDQKLGSVVSFDKGLTFQKIDFSQQNLSEFNNNDWYYGVNTSLSERQNGKANIFIKKNNIILFNLKNKMFYESKDWRTFSKIIVNKQFGIPDDAYPKESNYFSYDIYLFDNQCFFVNQNDFDYFSIFKSTDFINWEKIDLPSSLDFFDLKFYKKNLYLFTNH
jgi:hypothetical protein